MRLGDDNLRIRGRVTAIADGRDSIAAASEHMFAVFDAATGVCRHRRPEGQASLAFSHDDAYLAVGSFELAVIDMQTFQPRWTVRIGSQIKAIRWAPDDRHLALAAYNELVLVDADSGEVTVRVATTGFQRSAPNLAFTDTGVVYVEHVTMRTLSVSGESGEIAGTSYTVLALADDVYVATSDGGLVWRALDGTELARQPMTASYYHFMAADRTCDRIAIHVEDVLRLQLRAGGADSLVPLDRRFKAATLSDRRLVAGASGGELAIIGLDGSPRLEVSFAPPSSLAFVADARLACAGESGAVLRELVHGQVLAELGPYENVATAGDRILAWGTKGARVFDGAGAVIADLATAAIGFGTIAFDGVVALAPAGTTDTPMVFDERGEHVRTHTGNGNHDSYGCSSHNSWARNEPAVIAGMVFLTPARLLVFYENGTVEYDGAQRIERPYVPLPGAVVPLAEHVVVGDNGHHTIHPMGDGVVGEIEKRIWGMKRCAGRGHLIAFGTDDGRIVLYDARTQAEIGAHATHAWDVRAIAIDPTGSLIASSADDGTLVVNALWDGPSTG